MSGEPSRQPSDDQEEEEDEEMRPRARGRSGTVAESDEQSDRFSRSRSTVQNEREDIMRALRNRRAGRTGRTGPTQSDRRAVKRPLDTSGSGGGGAAGLMKLPGANFTPSSGFIQRVQNLNVAGARSSGGASTALARRPPPPPPRAHEPWKMFVSQDTRDPSEDLFKKRVIETVEEESEGAMETGASTSSSDEELKQKRKRMVDPSTSRMSSQPEPQQSGTDISMSEQSSAFRPAAREQVVFTTSGGTPTTSSHTSSIAQSSAAGPSTSASQETAEHSTRRRDRHDSISHRFRSSSGGSTDSFTVHPTRSRTPRTRTRRHRLERMGSSSTSTTSQESDEMPAGPRVSSASSSDEPGCSDQTPGMSTRSRVKRGARKMMEDDPKQGSSSSTTGKSPGEKTDQGPAKRQKSSDSDMDDD